MGRYNYKRQFVITGEGMTQTYFEGDEITIEEMPQGCVITDKALDKTIVISSIKDAEIVTLSLLRMIESFSKQNRGK